MGPYEFDAIDTRNLSRAECADLLAQVKALEGRLLAKLLSSLGEQVVHEADGSTGDRLLSIAEASQLLSVSKSWLYHNAKRHYLAVRLGDGTLRFSFLACQRYIKTCSRGASK